MSKNSYYIFKGLEIISWVIFVGLCIEAGGFIVNFVFNICNADFIPNLYQKLDLHEQYLSNKPVFFGIYSFILIISLLKAYLFYIVISLLSKLDLAKPFNSFVSEQIMQMSYFTFSIGILSYIARKTAEDLHYYKYAGGTLNEYWSDGQAFILMSAVIYVIATIFKKGVEIQNENDLTV